MRRESQLRVCVGALLVLVVAGMASGSLAHAEANAHLSSTTFSTNHLLTQLQGTLLAAAPQAQGEANIERQRKELETKLSLIDQRLDLEHLLLYKKTSTTSGVLLLVFGGVMTAAGLAAGITLFLVTLFTSNGGIGLLFLLLGLAITGGGIGMLVAGAKKMARIRRARSSNKNTLRRLQRERRMLLYDIMDLRRTSTSMGQVALPRVARCGLTLSW